MKDKIVLFLVTLLLPFCFIYAGEINDAALLSNELITDTFYYNENAGSEFKADLDVTEEKNVDGIYFVAGNNVSLKGSSEYGILAGNIVSIESNIEKDLFLGGNTIDFNGSVGRDSYIAGNIVNLNGYFGRNVKLFSEEVKLENVTIDGNIKVIGQKLTLGENVVINGVLTYNDDMDVSGLEGASILETKINHVEKNEEVKDTLLDVFKEFIFSTISLIIVAYAINLAFPSIYKKLDKKLEIMPLLNKGLAGLVMLIAIPIVSLIVMITEVGAGLSIIVLILFGILCYVGKLTILALLGNKLLELCSKKKANPYLSILVGIVVYKLLQLIPYVGGFVTFVALVIGFGYIKDLLFPVKTK